MKRVRYLVLVVSIIGCQQVLSQHEEPRDWADTQEIHKRTVHPSTMAALPYEYVHVYGSESSEQRCSCEQFTVTDLATVANLTVTGTSTFAGNVTTNRVSVGNDLSVVGVAAAERIAVGDGSVAAPGLTFQNAQDSGFYIPEAGSVAFATLGTQRFVVTSDGTLMIAEPTAANAQSLVVFGPSAAPAALFIAASGQDALQASGGVTVSGSSGLTLMGGGDLRINNNGSLIMTDLLAGRTVSLLVPEGIAESYVLKLPNTVGSANQVLTTNGSGTLSWSDMTLPARRLAAYRSPEQLLAVGDNGIIFNQVTIAHPNYDSNTGIFTVPTTGAYLVTAQVDIVQPVGIAGATLIDFHINGVAQRNGALITHALGIAVHATLTNILQLTAGDTLTVNALPSEACSVQADRTFFALQYLGS